MREIRELSAAIDAAQKDVPAGEALLVGISGIDASGKGFIAARLAAELERRGHRCALINIDGWLNLPSVRFSEKSPASHFYDNALRLDAVFEQLVLPLSKRRSIDLAAELVEETATAFRPFRYVFNEIQIILLEGIFLFKKRFADHFDLKIWIECRFETALARAVARGQEGLSPEMTVQAYEIIYFPAQQLHFKIDQPQSVADIVFCNE